MSGGGSRRTICDCDLSDEVWRDIPGYPGYQASSHGRFLGPRGVIRALHTYGNGYWGVTFRGRTHYTHRLICIAFHGEPPTPQHQAAHGDGNPKNNHPSNLRWATHSENTRDAIRHGTAQVLKFKHGGEEQAFHRLTWQKVDQIVELRATGMTQRQIGREVGVCKSTVGLVLRGETWTDRPGHAGDPPPIEVGGRTVNGVSVTEIRRTHCKNGHEFTAENTWRDAQGHRVCLECKRAISRRRKRALRERTASQRPATPDEGTDPMTSHEEAGL